MDKCFVYDSLTNRHTRVGSMLKPRFSKPNLLSAAETGEKSYSVLTQPSLSGEKRTAPK